MSQGGSKKVTHSLVAMSSAAVLAVYAAGYTRTRSAAERLESQASAHRPAPAGPPRTASPAAETAMTVPAGPAREVSRTIAQPKSPDAAAPAAPAPTSEPVVPPAEPKMETPPIAAPAPPAVPEPVVTPPPTPAPPAAPASTWKDGTYYGWGSSRHGDIQAAVVIEGGHIARATISQCLTRYSCSVIEKLPPEVAERQSPEVDYVSGATQSTNAFYYAVVEALGKAK